VRPVPGGDAEETATSRPPPTESVSQATIASERKTIHCGMAVTVGIGPDGYAL